MKVALSVLVVLVVTSFFWFKAGSGAHDSVEELEEPVAAAPDSLSTGHASFAQGTRTATQADGRFHASIDLKRVESRQGKGLGSELPLTGILEEQPDRGRVGKIVAFEGGSWSGTLEGRGRFVLRSMLGEHRLFISDAPIVLSRESPSAQAHVMPLTGKVVSVREASTGKELMGFDVDQYIPSSATPELEFYRASIDSNGFMETRHVEEARADWESSGDPLFLSISKPGYMSQRVVVPRQVHEVTVSLEQARRLEVRPQSRTEALGGVDVVTLADRDGRPIHRQVVPDSGGVVFSQLEPHSTVLVSQGPLDRNVGSEAIVRLEPGLNFIDLQRVGVRTQASLTVTLVVPVTWPSALFESIRIHASHAELGLVGQVGSDSWKSIGPGLWEARFASLPPGAYDLTVEPAIARDAVVLHSDSNVFSFDLSPACGVSAVADHHPLFDSDIRGRPRLQWWYVDDPGRIYNVFQSETTGFEFSCIDRDIALRVVSSSGLTPTQHVAPIAGEMTRVEISREILPVGRVHVSLLDGVGRKYLSSEERLSFSLMSADAEIVFTGPTLKSQYRSAGGVIALPDPSQATIVVSPPGRYQVEVEGLGISFEADFTEAGTPVGLWASEE